MAVKGKSERVSRESLAPRERVSRRATRAARADALGARTKIGERARDRYLDGLHRVSFFRRERARESRGEVEPRERVSRRARKSREPMRSALEPKLERE